jgi:hypothetical protein
VSHTRRWHSSRIALFPGCSFYASCTWKGNTLLQSMSNCTPCATLWITVEDDTQHFIIILPRSVYANREDALLSPVADTLVCWAASHLYAADTASTFSSQNWGWHTPFQYTAPTHVFTIITWPSEVMPAVNECSLSSVCWRHDGFTIHTRVHSDRKFKISQFPNGGKWHNSLFTVSFQIIPLKNSHGGRRIIAPILSRCSNFWQITAVNS